MIAFTGAIQASVSLVVFCVSDIKFALIGGRSGYLLDVMFAGLILSLIGLAGCAMKLGERMRAIRTGIMFTYPWSAILLGYAIAPADQLPQMGLGLLVLASWSLLALGLLGIPLAAKFRN